jgi:hypothetical protein
VPDAVPGWNSTGADLGGASANGNHHVSEPDDGPSDTAVIDPPDTARAEAVRRDPFSTAWLQDELTSPPDLGPGRPDQADAEPLPDDWFAPRETTEREHTWSSADTQPSPAVADAWFTPRERTDDGLAAPAPDMAPPAKSAPLVTGFWTPSTAAKSPAPTAASGPAPTPAAAAAPAAAASASAEVRRPDPPQAEGPTVARTIAERVVPPGPVVPPSEPRADRYYPVRLLVIIVVAALIGSVLVLLLR